jgi:hypothetical protein
MASLRLEIIAGKSSENTKNDCSRTQSAPHKRSKLMRMRSEHCAVVLTQILHSGQLVAAFSKARTNTEAMSSVRDSHHAVRTKALQCRSQAVVGTQDLFQFVVEMQELETKEQLIVEEAYFDDPRLPETHRARPPTSTPSVVGGLVSHAGPSDAPTSTPTVVGGLVSKAGPSVVNTAGDAARRTRVPIGNTYVNVLYMCQVQAQKRGAEGCCDMYLPPSPWGRSCSNMWHCEIDTSAWEAYAHFSYNVVAHVGCRARCKPFDAGNSIVCEIGANGCE